MPLPAPKPVDALRQHTRAVVLISAQGDASPLLLDAIRDSEVPCELIGHPLVAMAELVRLEQDNHHGAHERTALVVADDERIDQLDSLFHAVRVRLPRVAIWVVAGEFAVQVQRASQPTSDGKPETNSHAPVGRSPAAGSTGAHRPASTHQFPRSVPPLRIADGSIDLDETPLRAVEPASDAPPREKPPVEDDDPEPPSTDRKSTALTAAELDMLLGWDDEETQPKDGGRR